MKRIFLPLLMLAFTFTSCNQKSTISPTTTNSKPDLSSVASYATPENVDALREYYVAKWAPIGIKHNEGLEMMRAKLSTMPPLAHVDKTTDINLVKNQAVQYLSDCSEIANSTELSQAQKTSIFNQTWDPHFDYVSPYITVPTPTDVFNTNTINNAAISQELKNELTALFAVINQELSVEDFDNQMTEAEKHALLTLDNETEIDLLFAATAVGRASNHYWAENTDAWIYSFGTITQGGTTPSADKVNMNSGPIKGMQGADVGGLVSGALGGLLTTGPGGMLMGAVIGGCTASTAKVVENVWNHFFP